MKYSKTVRECWAVHEALRRLGFQANDIYVSGGQELGHPDVPYALFVVVRTQDKEFVANCGKFATMADADAAVDEWTRFATALCDDKFEEEALRRIYVDSRVYEDATQFMRAIVATGMRPPCQFN
jgi:hypothetical protein